MNNTEIRNRIIEILEGLDRPGTEAVINYLKTSSYFNRGCYGHHKEQGGLAKHSLEVYERLCFMILERRLAVAERVTLIVH